MKGYEEVMFDNMVNWMFIRRGANARNDEEMAEKAEASIFAILGCAADMRSPVPELPIEDGCVKLVSGK